MANQDPKGRPDNNNGGKPRLSIIWLIVAVIVMTILGNQFINMVRSSQQEETTYDAFLSALENNEISQVQIEADRIDYILKQDEDSRLKRVYYTGILPNVDLTPVVGQLRESGVKFSGEIVEQSSMIFS